MTASIIQRRLWALGRSLPRPAPRATPPVMDKCVDKPSLPPVAAFDGSWPNRPREILKRIFGYDYFRGHQEEVINLVVDGEDVVVLMPTGGGKSLTFQIPAIARPGVALVICPLIALMRDQVIALRQNGISAEMLSSDMPVDERRRIMNDFVNGRMKLLYVAPERLVTPDFRDAMHRAPLSMIAIDEAHCVSQWGHDFRQDYLRIGEVTRGLNVPRIAVTATASKHVLKDMLKRLEMTEAKIFKGNFDRPNLRYEIVEKYDENSQLLNFLSDHRGESGVIYCNKRISTEEISKMVRGHGYDALPYHAGMSAKDRHTNQDRFIREEAVIIVATTAFGMGIDKPNVRFVGHTSIPSSLEGYYQETGRAGRDGLPSHVWMCWNGQDVARIAGNIDRSTDRTEEAKAASKRLLNEMRAFAEAATCRRTNILRHFGQEHPGSCNLCDRCLNPVETYEGLDDARLLLAACTDTGQQYGLVYLAKVLKGEGERLDSDVRKRSHNKLKCHGLGASRHEKHWEHVGRQLLALGLLVQPPERRGGYAVSEEGMRIRQWMDNPSILLSKSKWMDNSVSKIRRTVNVPRVTDAPPVTGLPYSMPLSAPMKLVEGVPPERKELWEALRTMRMEISREEDIPPFLVFQDTTLVAIVSSMPDSISALGKIHGMGVSKTARYGERVLAVVSRFRTKPANPTQIKLPGFGFGR
jgi:ATP-dependent DNA helicase RecQ